jgi:7-keto-8-aminopelargonate synthetase-like enzyme
VRFLLDKLAHASLLDAVRGSGAQWRIFPHNHVAKLARLLSETDRDELQVVVTESIFSMDGDAGDLSGIVKLKEKHNFVLLVDEAHASGVYGAGGCGYAGEIGVSGAVDISVITLSKAAGCIGGAVCASEEFCQMVLNTGRAYVYSTSPPPPIASAIETAIAVMRDEPPRQLRVREIARDVRSQLRTAGFNLPNGDSPIIPIILGSESTALKAAEKLCAAGLLIAAVRPPTVARGTSRLRVTLSCEHTDSEISLLISELKKCVKPGGVAD